MDSTDTNGSLWDGGDMYNPGAFNDPTEFCRAWDALRHPGQPTTNEIIDALTVQAGSWTLHGTSFEEERKAKLLAGQLFVFFTTVKVVKQNDRFYILCWNKEKPTNG